MEDKLLTASETAEFLRVSEPTLARWRCAGGGPKFRRVGAKRNARIVYALSTLQDWVASREFQSTTEADAADQMIQQGGGL